MKRFVSLLLVLGCVALPHCGYSQSASTRFPITIIGASQPLAKQSLSVTVDQQPVTIDELTPAVNEPLDFVVIFDISGSNRDKAAFLRTNSLQLFDALISAGYHGILGDFNDELYLDPKTDTHDAAVKELQQVNFRGGTAFYSSVADAAKLLQKHFPDPGHRHAVFVFTDGQDNASSRSLQESVSEVQRAEVSVYCIGLLEGKPPQRAVEALNLMSSYTGGAPIFLDEPKEYIPTLLALLKQQYWISITPGIHDKKVHQLSISANQPTLKVFAPTELRAAK